MLKSFRRWAARLLAPLAIVGAVAIPAITAGPASAVTGTFVADCGNIPWYALNGYVECPQGSKMVNVNNVIQYAEAKGTHSWSKFFMAYWAYDNNGNPIGNGYGPWQWTGTDWHVVGVPAGTHQVDMYIWNFNDAHVTDHFYGAIAW